MVAGILVGLMLAVTTPALAAEDAQTMVERTTMEMLKILVDNRQRLQTDSGFLDREVERVVVPHLDFESMTKLAVAAHWRRATDAQQASLVKEFRTLLLRTYTKSLSEFSDQTVEFLPARPTGRDDRAVVRSRILPRSGPEIPIEYKLRLLDDGAWKIYDITIDNISLVTNYRTSFATQIRQAGIDGLIASLAEKNGERKP